MPFRTWYVSSAATADGSMELPELLLRKVLKASLLGAKMVMFEALVKAETMFGLAARRLPKVDRVELFWAKTSVRLWDATA